MAWRRGDCIGKGGYGEVFIAIPSNPAFKTMAVKSVPKENAASLLIEYQILEKLRDVPGVVQTFGLETRESEPRSGGGRRTYNLLMELSPRGSLVNLIADYSLLSGIPESHVRGYARMILRALSSIHSLGFIHCDIKPDNVLVFPESLFELKIADFRLATETWKLGPGSRIFTGTLRYMPPEAAVEGQVSPAMDVWGLGCTVVEMLTGNLPWSRFKEDGEVLREIVAGRTPEIPEWLSAKGKDFLSKCFARDPNHRLHVEMFLKHPFVADYGVIGDRRTKTAAVFGGGGMEMQRSPVAVRPRQLFQSGRAAALMC
ncbi:unnamed protein product [Linum tenue]|uniref:Protein kinase domain-containing protein n=1 Tax=Linum tenue TaxID=586396 RepID=A0AAV0IUH2_9ROSI|nr:unnamed protein product [Linum tenue]